MNYMSCTTQKLGHTSHYLQQHKKKNCTKTEYFYEKLLKLVELETVFNEKHTHERERSEWEDNIIDSVGAMRNDDNTFLVQICIHDEA